MRTRINGGTATNGTAGEKEAPKVTHESYDIPKRDFGRRYGEKQERSVENREDRPRRSYGDKDNSDRPRRSFGSRDDRPRRSFSDKDHEDRPRRSYGDKDNSDRPRRSFGSRDDRPRRSFSDKDREDRPRRSYGDKDHEDRPRRSYGDKDNADRPRRSFGSRDDRPRRSFSDKDHEERPRRSYGDKENADRPRRSFGSRDDRPRRSFSDKDREDRPRRSYGDKDNSDRPRRSFGSRDDRPRRSFSDKDREDRPRRSYGDKDNSDRPRRSFGSRDDRPRRSFSDKNHEDRPRRSYGNREDGPTKSLAPKRAEKAKGERPVAKQPSNPDQIRLNKYIANSGICSRREADEYIIEGLITVNGVVVTELGTKININDDIRYNGERLKGEKKVYIIMNKPKDFVTTTSDPHAEKNVMDLINPQLCPERVFPVGRLDKSTTGVLLFTNDGELTETLTHPSYQRKKIYQVTLDKNLKKSDFEVLLSGFELEDGFVAADAISYIGEKEDTVGLEIHSGRNRIVRRMFEHLQYDVKRLDRVYFAGLTKKNIRRGQWRFLTDQEVAMLKMGTYE